MVIHRSTGTKTIWRCGGNLTVVDAVVMVYSFKGVPNDPSRQCFRPNRSFDRIFPTASMLPGGQLNMGLSALGPEMNRGLHAGSLPAACHMRSHPSGYARKPFISPP
ncbi:predicted protein [Pyrenophora tritici-repentis Pt-1C-BFP]|uniref:Uncharacterized protein n=1 Tax=Pyrenophora tritici-repentis (strain Pt-1C-BFP) TaxID=426418 RepID=B2W4E2_PYRTR|nr:uncharacterized protein PTRG_04492 [Pyrenophora tritici-repentis Pt-1C-BFP]EDU47399.1 predicted protein [Pyrenophora tritici-repentis Pt-1C-BFP]